MKPETRPEDIPLHSDVRRLAAALGRVIRRLEGNEAFSVVETLRRSTRARRHGNPNAPTLETLLSQVEALPVELCAAAARAFTLFFLLINTADQVHRVRRARAYASSADTEPQPASALWTMRRLRSEGHSSAEVLAMLRVLDVRPVLTAHPTESTRRTLLALQARVADLLLEWEATPESERGALEDRLDGEIELLWLTAEIRDDRPTVLDEVSTVLWYLETRLVDASARATEALLRAFEDEFGAIAAKTEIIAPVRIGNWVGGDRDGNPFVTADTTLAAARRASHIMLGRYRKSIDELIERLSISAALAQPPQSLLDSLTVDREALPEIWSANHVRNAEEPIRLKLSFISARLTATRRVVASRDAGSPQPEPAAYVNAGEFHRDLALVRETLMSAGATSACRTFLDPLLAMVHAHGFHGFLMDIREHADVLRSAAQELATKPREESEALRRVTDTFRAIRTVQDECGEAAASTFIISMAREPDDLLRVLSFARDAGLVDMGAEPARSSLDVVPLFETLSDLDGAPTVMRELLDHPEYQRQLAARGNRQEVMIGYSDSAKDAGLLSASWALYRAQEELAALFAERDVELRIFHGRGGGVGRGGGSPVQRAISALPPDTLRGRIKITEQGEIISQQFGLLPVAERSLEVSMSGVLLHAFSDWRSGVEPETIQRFRDVMDSLSELSHRYYRATAHENPDLFTLFGAATPVAELADARFGSRPAYRPGANPGIDGIRAIPWAFGWTQIRLMLVGWLGVGTALDAACNTDEGLRELREMTKRWPFFDDFISRVEMVCAKTDLAIARLYVEKLGGDRTLLSELEKEFDRTVNSLMRIRGTDALITDVPVLQAAIALRNPYVDPLSLLQVSLMRRKRDAETAGENHEAIDAVLSTTLSGIAQGLRNTA